MPLKLMAVHEIAATYEPEVYVFDLTYNDGARDERVHFCLRPEDPYGLSPIVRVWWEGNRSFPVKPYLTSAEPS